MVSPPPRRGNVLSAASQGGGDMEKVANKTERMLACSTHTSTRLLFTCATRACLFQATPFSPLSNAFLVFVGGQFLLSYSPSVVFSALAWRPAVCPSAPS